MMYKQENIKKNHFIEVKNETTLLAGAVEYGDCISAEGVRHYHQ